MHEPAIIVILSAILMTHKKQKMGMIVTEGTAIKEGIHFWKKDGQALDKIIMKFSRP